VDIEVRGQEGRGRVHRLANPGEKRKDLLSIRDLAEASTLVPVIDARYPLPRITDAYRYVDAGHKKGNVVVTLTDPP